MATGQKQQEAKIKRKPIQQKNNSLQFSASLSMHIKLIALNFT